MKGEAELEQHIKWKWKIGKITGDAVIKKRRELKYHMPAKSMPQENVIKNVKILRKQKLVVPMEL